jgi:DNA invertase Pin-like site-specific DNA recombinase
LQVNHKCKTDGKCINPDHLYLGTARQNTEDSVKDGTKNKAKSGENNHNAVLSDELIEYIKSLKGSGRYQYEIAKEYGINQSQISRWWNNKTRTVDE